MSPDFLFLSRTYPVGIGENRRVQRLVGEELVEVSHQLQRFEGSSSRCVDTLQLVAQVDYFRGDRLHRGVELLK